MLKLIICEFSKLKRKKLCYIAFLTTFIMPFLYVLILNNRSMENLMLVTREENGFLVLIPLSVVVATNLFFEEHDYDTLKNLMCLVTGTALDGWALQLFLNFCTGIFLWAAAMPCLVLVVWFNKSYIISVIIAFAYMILGYIMHINDAFLWVPLGPNVATFLPVPMIFRWLYQFNNIEGAGEIMISFYNEFKPYFVPTPVLFAILITEAAVCMVLLMHIYRKQDL